jgi:hypothetical protein
VVELELIEVFKADEALAVLLGTELGSLVFEEDIFRF